MINKRGFAILSLLMVLAIIGLSALIGFRFYGFKQGENTGVEILQDKARDAVVQANAEAIRSLLQGALAAGDVDLDEAVRLAQNAGLHDPYQEKAMNTSEWFPQVADSPGEIQIQLLEDTFYIQGYGSDGFLDKILMVKK